MEEWAKPKPTDGLVSRYLNRKVSTRVTRLLLRYAPSVSPNTVSLLTAVLGWLSALLTALGYHVIGGVLVQVSSILDGVDGEIARATGRVTRVGGFLDAILDRYVDITIIASLALLSIKLGYNPQLVLLVSLAALTGDLMVSYVHARGEASLGKNPALIGRLRGFATRDVRMLVLAIAAVIARPLEGLLVVAVLGHTYTILKTLEVLVNVKRATLS